MDYYCGYCGLETIASVFSSQARQLSRGLSDSAKETLFVKFITYLQLDVGLSLSCDDGILDLAQT